MQALRSSRFALLSTRRYSVWEVQHTAATEQIVSDPAATHKALLALLDSRGVPYKLTHHEEVRTSEEAAAIRGATLASGAKAMLLAKDTESFVLIVLSASEKLSWSKARKLFGKKLNLATEEQVVECTGCLPGSVPPFGRLFKGQVPTYCDHSLLRQGETINFNCGLRTASIAMSVHDYLAVEEPTMIDVI